jgi:hypothetical protein
VFDGELVAIADGQPFFPLACQRLLHGERSGARQLCGNYRLFPSTGMVARSRACLVRKRHYQSAWTAVPLCSVATVPLAPHATAADRSGQLSAASCQCLAMPAGDA